MAEYGRERDGVKRETTRRGSRAPRFIGFDGDTRDATLNDSGEARKSKSQRKRESLELQVLGETLTTLSPSDLDRIPTWPDLRSAVAGARGLERSALRRQIRYIGRLLREGDAGAIARAVDAVRRPGRREAARHRRIERLRDALIGGDAALERVRDAMPELDFQRLRGLVIAARRERAGKPGGTSERRLFRFLRDGGLDAVDDVIQPGGSLPSDTTSEDSSGAGSGPVPAENRIRRLLADID